MINIGNWQFCTKWQSYVTNRSYRVLTKGVFYGTIIKRNYAGMSELADEADSKSVGSDTVWVRPPLPAPKPDHMVGLFLTYLEVHI